MNWKVGDWVIFDCNVGQVKQIGDGFESFTNGFFEASGKLADRFRPLTLRNKRIAECFEMYYKRLRDIDGSAGFNYPRISQYFYQLSLDAIDDEAAEKEYHEKAQDFIQRAHNYERMIHNVALFRPR